MRPSNSFDTPTPTLQNTPSGLSGEAVISRPIHSLWRAALIACLGFGLVLLMYAVMQIDAQTRAKIATGMAYIWHQEWFWMALAVGLTAQLIDGALGMAYGLSSSTFLMSMGASPAATSGAVHLAEMFTTAFSGLAHHRLGNVDKVLFFKLAIPGVISGLLGVWVLTSMDGQLIQPWVSAYLLVMGVFVIRKSLLAQQHKPTHQLRHVRQLALMGGFLDAIGGGGWGPIVTSGILGQGHDPRKTIGTVNAAEFLVTLATGLGFVVLGAIEHGVLVAGLVVGGLIAAPLAAFLTSRLPTRLLMGLVGLLISALSAYTLLRWLNPF